MTTTCAVIFLLVVIWLVMCLGGCESDNTHQCTQGESVLVKRETVYRPGGGSFTLFTFSVSQDTARLYVKGDLVPWEALGKD